MDMDTKEEADVKVDNNGDNVSVESEHLDPEEKAATEADTLPMDGKDNPAPTKSKRYAVIIQKRIKLY